MGEVDPSAWAAIGASATGMIVALGGVSAQWKGANRTQMKELREDLAEALKELAETRDSLLIAEGSIFRLRRILVRHNLMTEHELEHGEAPLDA